MLGHLALADNLLNTIIVINIWEPSYLERPDQFVPSFWSSSKMYNMLPHEACLFFTNTSDLYPILPSTTEVLNDFEIQ